jgi:serine/threonine protein kinase
MPVRLESGAEPIPGYKLIERLGGGGFGEVWKAEAPGGLLKAIKFVYGDLQTASPDGQRAEQELKALSRVKTVRHPYILSLERYDIIDGQLLIVMELADRNLWDRFKECRAQGLQGIPRDELLNIMEESAEALDLMNTQYGLQHLDIKPQNIFLVYNHIKVADFGLVKDLQGMTATVTGGVTPVYAAPETFDGLVSRFCDQYSLAIVYQELLTGQRPFGGTNVHQLIMQHVQGKPNLTSLPSHDQSIIGRALAKSPDERFPSCGDLVRALREVREKGGSPPKIKESAPALLRPVKPSSGSYEVRTIPGKAAVAPPPPVVPPAPVSPIAPPSTPTPTPNRRIAIEEPPPQPIAVPVMTAPPEATGDGELFPALIVGVGQLGLNVLQQLRQSVLENFGSPSSLPNLGLLYLDTDPDGPTAATRPTQGAALAASEVVLARLNRFIHYQKPREGRPRIDTWFNTNLLHRIPRNLTTDGLRSLARLAFIDNYRQIAGRLREDLDSCLDPEALAAAGKKTGLQMRSNRPRVYIVASLSGGTGSGIFIDLAYTTRSILKRLGYDQPQVIAVLLAPIPDPNSPKKALVNTVAGLMELNHFSTEEVNFTARFDDREGTIVDPEAPFARTIILAPSRDAEEESAAQEVATVASEFLFRDLTTPLGRVADQGRAKMASPRQSATMHCQTLGLFRMAWPKRLLVRRAGRRYCKHLVQRWMSKETEGLKPEIQSWLEDQWTKGELDYKFLIERLQMAGEKALGMTPEYAFSSITDPFVPKGKKPPVVDANGFLEAIVKLDKIVGHPTPSQVGYTPGVLEETLRKEAERLFEEWEEKVTRLTMRLIEQPQFRLPGADESIRQVIAKIDQTILHNDPLSQEYTENTAKAYDRLEQLRPYVHEIVRGGRSTARELAEAVELLRQYPKWRYQSLVLRHVNSTFSKVRDFLSDKTREIAFCRTRLAELARAFDEPPGDDKTTKKLGSGLYMFPAGCRNIAETTERLFPPITQTDLDALDSKVQEVIRQGFTSLLHVIMTAASNLLKNLENAMSAEGEAYAVTRMPETSVVEMFLSRHSDPEKTIDQLIQAYDEAAPKLSKGESTSLTELCVLAAPPGPQEGRFRDMARRAIPDTELLAAPSPDDIVFYREETQLPLGKLEYLTPEIMQMYRQALSSEHFPPHSRNDVDWLEPMAE